MLKLHRPLLPDWRFWPAVPLAGLLILAIAGFSTSANPPSEPIHANEQSNNAKNAIDDDSSIFLSAISFVDTHNAAIIAVSTVLLALVTGGLVWVAYVQLRTTRRQLRAYVALTPKTASNFLTGTVQIAGVTKNYGDTPALLIWHEFDIGIFPGILPPDFTYPRPTLKIEKTFGAFPDSEHYSWFNKTLAASEIAAVMSGTHALHIWGTTHYVDAFGKGRKTQFQAFTDRQFAASVNAVNNGQPDPRFTWIWGASHHSAD